MRRSITLSFQPIKYEAAASLVAWLFPEVKSAYQHVYNSLANTLYDFFLRYIHLAEAFIQSDLQHVDKTPKLQKSMQVQQIGWTASNAAFRKKLFNGSSLAYNFPVFFLFTT